MNKKIISLLIGLILVSLIITSFNTSSSDLFEVGGSYYIRTADVNGIITVKENKGNWLVADFTQKRGIVSEINEKTSHFNKKNIIVFRKIN